MKSKLRLLDGKYYGTEIEVNFEDGHAEEVIKLWDSGDYDPSVRELERLGYTQEQWDKNEEVDDGWGGKTEIQKADLFPDSHFESKVTYERALKLISLITAT